MTSVVLTKEVSSVRLKVLLLASTSIQVHQPANWVSEIRMRS
jgi:hypothetical protein